MKDTAVDFLMGKLFDPSTMVDEQIQWFEQAKEMQKEQMCDFVEYCQTEHSKYQETEASWIKELTIDDLFEKRYTK
jgi:hypothetical protein